MYKLFENVINETILNAFTEKNSVSEYATTSVSKEKQLGSETVAFNSHEAIYSTLELEDTAYVAFLDTHKAIDTVLHKGLLHKLRLLRMNPQS